MRLLTLIYSITILGLLLFMALSYSQSTNLIIGFSSKREVWPYIVPLVAMASYFGGNLMFNRTVSQITEESPLKQKLTHYLQAGIIRYILLEGSAFIGVIAYRENHNIFYLAIVASLILYLLKLRPTKEGVIRDLGLKGEEKEIFLKKEAEIL